MIIGLEELYEDSCMFTRFNFFLAILRLGILNTFQMWLDEYFLNLLHHDCERSIKMCFPNLLVICEQKKSIAKRLLPHIAYPIILLSMQCFSINQT